MESLACATLLYVAGAMRPDRAPGAGLDTDVRRHGLAGGYATALLCAPQDAASDLLPVTQFFSFHNSQFTAVFGLVIALLTYVTIRLMIREEEAREESRSPHGSQGSAPGRLD